MSGPGRPRVGVGVAVWRFNPTNNVQEVLLGKRKNSHGAGEWSFPGGKIDGDEHPEAAALREVHEEIGCYVEDMRVVPFWSFETYPELPFNFVTLYFSAKLKEGDAVQNMEPHKCEGWQWFPWSGFLGLELPSPLFGGIASLRVAVPHF